MSEFVASSTDYEVVENEPPELLGRNLVSAGHLLASATAFFFLSFVFAYFYLRSLNNSNLFKPKGVHASVAFGTVIMLLMVGSAVLVRLGLTDQRAARREQWRLKALIGLLLGLASVVVQLIEWPSLSFGPTGGGYASVFFGWTAFNLLFVLGGLYWLEVLWATAHRYRNVPVGGMPAEGEASSDAYRGGQDISDPLSLVRPGLEAFSFFWSFLAGLAVLAWVILYLL